MAGNKKLTLWDATMLIMGSMIGSGIFLVTAGIAKVTPYPGLILLSWVFTLIITLFGALSYGELAGMFPAAGGQYVYLKEVFGKRIGFLYGWTVFSVIQTGTIAAVGIAFAKFTGIFLPWISDQHVLIPLFGRFNLNTQNLLAIVVIWLLTGVNLRGLSLGAAVQNIFTVTKILAIILLIIIGIWLSMTMPAVQTVPFLPDTWDNGLLLAFFSGLTGSLFSADAWNNITYTAGEVDNPRKTIPVSLIIGTGTVCLLYLLANVGYTGVLTVQELQEAPHGRVGALLMEKAFGNTGGMLMAALVMVSTFGCINGLILSGSRLYAAMAQDHCFIPMAAKMNRHEVPQNSLILQAVWTSLLAMSGSYGQLLDFVMFATIGFYVLTILGLFILRFKRPEAERPYKVLLYPFLPLIYILLCAAFCFSVAVLQGEQVIWSLAIVATGFPVYWLIRRFVHSA